MGLRASEIRRLVVWIIVLSASTLLAATSPGIGAGLESPRLCKAGAGASNITPPLDAPKYHAHERVYANRVLNLKDSPEKIAVILQSLRIGDLCVCAIPFEVFVEVGLELKHKSPFDRTFTICHANGSHGHLPTAGQHELGGYETWLGTNCVEVQAADKIVKSLLTMLNEMRLPERAISE